MSDQDFLSIGEVLAQLLDEFPDVTISKIRFLEGQGLISPERSPSGYRKFTETEVDRLRVILREQKANYLPLKVIKDRLEDDSSDISRELRDVSDGVIRSDGHPAARAAVPRPSADGPTGGSQDALAREQRRVARRHADDTESLPREALLRNIAISPEFLAELERAGLVSGHDVGDTTFFEPHSVAVARAAARFQELGVDVRHLRSWKASTDRELGLFEQRILPLLMQRNPASRSQAIAMLDELVSLGAELRAAILARETARLVEPR